MRGEISGVETRLKEVLPNLLPLGGDTVHKCHTAAKELLKPLDGGIEAFLTESVAQDFTSSSTIAILKLKNLVNT